MRQTTHSIANERPLNWPALCEVALLALVATLLLTKVARGVLAFYIHPRYTPLVVGCAIILLCIAGVRMRAVFQATPERFAGRGVVYMLLLVPLLFGIVVPAAPLGADTLGGRGLSSFSGAATRWGAPKNDATTTWNLLDWASALSTDTGALAAAPVSVDGFVLRPDGTTGSQFYVARYVISCCAADASGVGLPVIWKNGAQLTTDSWIHVSGTLGTTTIGGQQQPAIIATELTAISQPPQPYLYP